MTDGQLDARTQRCEELSGKGKALSNGVQADAVDAGPRSGHARARRSGMPNPALHLTAAARVRRRESNSRLRQHARVSCGSWLLKRKS
jgi:hypothetical protein